MLSTIVDPLSEENPNGCSINYDSHFEELKNEISRQGNIDFSLIERNALKLLKEKSKDLRVISYLSLVYLHNSDWEKFADVFEGLAVLAQGDFDQLYPDRQRARQMAIEWMSQERYSRFLMERKPGSADYDQIKRLIKSLEKLKLELDNRFTENSPFPLNLLKSAQEWESLCRPAPLSSAPNKQPEKQEETPKQVQSRIKESAQLLIEKEPAKASGYRIMRCIRWDHLEKAPKAENGRTLLSSPDEGQRKLFVNLLERKDWKQMLERSEAVFSSGAAHLWLDLQCYSSCASRALGYDEVHEAIVYETERLLNRIPGLSSLSFSDGFPFCDEMTKSWIETEVKRFKGREESSCRKTGQEEDAFEEERTAAVGLVAEGRFEEAIEAVQNGKPPVNAREGFRRSLLIAEILLKASQADSASVVLESLEERIERFRIDLWEPELAVDTWALLWKACRDAKMTSESRHEKQKLILKKVMEIDPGRGLRINK